MKATGINNAELVIEANEKKAGDYDAALRVAAKMVEIAAGYNWTVAIASAEQDLWVHVCADWQGKQADDMRDLYRDAKAAA